MTTLAPDPVDEARMRDRQAWDTYGQACHDPLATDAERSLAFHKALVTMSSLVREQRER